MSVVYGWATRVVDSPSGSPERSITVEADNLTTVDSCVVISPGLDLISLRSAVGISIVMTELFIVVTTSPCNWNSSVGLFTEFCKVT